MDTERGGPRVVAALAAGLLVVAALAGCSDADPSASGEPSAASDASVPAAAPQRHAVGVFEATYVDGSRPTPENGAAPGLPDRTLETLFLYPAEGDPGDGTPSAEEDAEPDTAGGPYPLVLFAHGLGGPLELYQPMLEEWAAAGYVVAAPRFPLTAPDAAGGANPGDVQNQPGDVSFVIDQVSEAAEASAGDGGGGGADAVLAGLVDTGAIAVAGHSNGAITALGLAANSCCRDSRIDAALVLAGTDSPFNGDYDLADTPPLLLVHGTEDAQLSYDAAVTIFNEAEGPKGLLTLEGENHADWFYQGDTFDGVVAASTSFLDAYLRDDAAAEERLATFEADDMTLDWVPEEGSDTTIPTTPEPETDRQATATPTDGLTAGQLVTVTWEGFLPGGTVNVVQCSGDGVSGGSAACDLNDAYILQADPTGEGSTQIDIVVGAVGDGVCDAANPCWIVVNDSGLTDEDAIIRIPITLAG